MPKAYLPTASKYLFRRSHRQCHSVRIYLGEIQREKGLSFVKLRWRICSKKTTPFLQFCESAKCFEQTVDVTCVTSRPITGRVTSLRVGGVFSGENNVTCLTNDAQQKILHAVQGLQRFEGCNVVLTRFLHISLCCFVNIVLDRRKIQ